MARTITAAAAAQAARYDGAFPRRIVEIQWGGGVGTKYYSGETMTEPVDATGIVKEWGGVSTAAEPDKVGGHGQWNVRLADTDHSLLALMAAKPGPRNRPVYLWLHFDGTDWLDDRICLFGGAIVDAKWDENSAEWDVTCKGFEASLNPHIGQPMSRQIFPEVHCSSDEGQTIPIVYGDPVYRVPARIVDRPGRGYVGTNFGVHDETLYLSQTAAAGGFTSGVEITLVVGLGRTFELVTGSFASSGTNAFNVTSRSSIAGSGSSPGTFGEDGQRFFLISADDVASPGVARGGFPLFVYDEFSDSWLTFVVQRWEASGSSIITIQEPPDYTFTTGQAWKLGAWPGVIPFWQGGTPVAEVGNWTYAVNFLPSGWVFYVEGKAGAGGQEGGAFDQFYTLSDERWSANLDNRSWNLSLGRTADDPGITTVTLNTAPAAYGLEAETVYVTLRGTRDTDGPVPADSDDAAVYTGPGQVIRQLLASTWLGNLSTAFIDSASFDEVDAAAITQCRFAITERKKLLELCGDIAYQHGILFYWDGGQARVVPLAASLDSADSELTITANSYAAGSLSIKSQQEGDVVTRMTGKFAVSSAAPEVTMVRTSVEAEAVYEEQERTIELWSVQNPVDVALCLEFWLEYFLTRSMRVELDLFLQGIALQPGSVVTLDIDDGAGVGIFDSVKARVIDLRHEAGNAQSGAPERIRARFDVPLWPWTIEVNVPESNATCVAPLNVEPWTITQKSDPANIGYTFLSPTNISVSTGSSGGGGGGGTRLFWGTTNADHARGANGSVTVEGGSILSAYNDFADLESGARVVVWQKGVDDYVLIAGACPASA